jgi:hypothetical protein
VIRLWHSVSAWGNDRILAANWDYVDVYELVAPAEATQADITASSQRLRFSPTGGTQLVQLVNDGCVPLEIDQITSTGASFEVTPTSGTIPPGEFVDLSVTYAGGAPGSALILVESNDPDEGTLPIQVFGATEHLDPGESAVDFVVESWTYDHEADEFIMGIFDLAAHAGRVVYLHVFAPG